MILHELNVFFFFNIVEKRSKSTHPNYENKKQIKKSNKIEQTKKKEIKIKQRFKSVELGSNCRKPLDRKKLNRIILLVDNLMFNFYALVVRHGRTRIIY